MAMHDLTPDVFEAAAILAAENRMSVDAALARLQRAARTAGLSPGQLANQLIVTSGARPSLTVEEPPTTVSAGPRWSATSDHE